MIRRVVYFVTPDMFKIFGSMEHHASFRLRSLNQHKRLLRDGHQSIITYDLNDIKPDDIVVFNSFGPTEVEITKISRHLVHDYTENINGIPELDYVKKKCSYIVCSSFKLMEIQHSLGFRGHCIRDPHEEYGMQNFAKKNTRKKVVWCGMGGNVRWPRMVAPIIKSLGMEYVEISNLPDSTIQWKNDTWLYEMAKCDIAICPQDHWGQPAKSNVKATTALALGLPVVCSPTQAYMEVKEIEPENTFISETLENWEEHLLNLRDRNPDRTIGSKVRDKYSPERLYQQWLDLFKSLSI